MINEIFKTSYTFHICNKYSAYKCQKVRGMSSSLTGSRKTASSGANIFWLGTTEGTSTNAEGFFELNRYEKDHADLVISYVGYRNDTLSLAPDQRNLEIVLSENATLDEVEIADRALVLISPGPI